MHDVDQHREHQQRRDEKCDGAMDQSSARIRPQIGDHDRCCEHQQGHTRHGEFAERLRTDGADAERPRLHGVDEADHLVHHERVIDEEVQEERDPRGDGPAAARDGEHRQQHHHPQVLHVLVRLAVAAVHVDAQHVRRIPPDHHHDVDEPQDHIDAEHHGGDEHHRALIAEQPFPLVRKRGEDRHPWTSPVVLAVSTAACCFARRRRLTIIVCRGV